MASTLSASASASASDSTSTSTASFAQELNTLREQYESNEQTRNDRNQEALIKATDYFLDKYARSKEARVQFEESAREAASFGKKLVQLETWSGRGPVYQHQSLSDMLDFGDLCARMQDYFNLTYGEDEFRVFHYPIRNSRTTALTVSWDKAGFENADGIIRSNRERAQQRLEHREHNGRDGREREESDQRPRRRDYDSGANGNNSNWTPRRRDQQSGAPGATQGFRPRSAGPQSWGGDQEGSRTSDGRNQGPRQNRGPRLASGPPRNAPTQETDETGASTAAGGMRPRRRLPPN
jgi:hypothetical protein